MAEPLSHILVVEDEETHVELMRRAFVATTGRFSLQVANSLQEARACLAQSRPDLIITDLLLPDGQGMELVTARDEPSAFPIVVMTSFGNEQVAVEAMRAGALDYVVKSVTTLADMPHVAERALREWEHIVERRRAEAAQRASEERYRALYRDNPTMLFTVAADGKIISVNAFGASQLGYTTDELEGQSVLKVFYEPDQPAVIERLKTCLQNPWQVYRWQFRKVRRDGSILWVEEFARTVVGPEGVPHVLVVCQDITERVRTEAVRQQAEQALQVRLDQLAALSRASQLVTASLDLDTVLTHILALAGQVSAADYAQVFLTDDTGNVIRSIENLPGVTDLPRRIRREGLTQRIMRSRQMMIVNEIKPDGRVTNGEEPWSVNPVVLGVGVQSLAGLPLLVKERLLGVLFLYSLRPTTFHAQESLLATFANQAAIAIENARLYQAEREQFRRLQESQSRLIQVEKMSALGRLAASITHEINNPLQAIQNSIELLQEELEGQQRRTILERYSNLAQDEVKRLVTIVRRMRDFYRPARQELQPTDVHAILSSVIELADKQLQRAHVALEQDLIHLLPPIQANPDHLKQVFLNLMLNASEAMPNGGRLLIRTTLVPAPWRDDAPPGSAIRVDFQDAGEGIQPEILSHLFEPFVTSKKEGTGLGLSICYEIVQAHQGQIAADSTPGAGTTFTVWLPVPPAAAADSPSADPRVAGHVS